jgi:arsenate reductase
MSAKIWHNPRCSKSRETLALLTARGIEPQIVLYLDEPPSAEEIRKAATALGCSVRDMMRTKEPAYNELGLDHREMGDSDLAKAMSENPILIERPVVFKSKKAALGRPPEAVLVLFD